jgi:hypothetical protein
MMIDSSSSLKAGDVVRLTFRLPASGEQIDGDGVVVWASEHRHGIRFMRMNPQSTSAIKNFIAEIEQLD